MTVKLRIRERFVELGLTTPPSSVFPQLSLIVPFCRPHFTPEQAGIAWRGGGERQALLPMVKTRNTNSQSCPGLEKSRIFGGPDVSGHSYLVAAPELHI